MKNNFVKAIATLGLISTLSTVASAADFGMAADISGNNSSQIRGIVKLDETMRLEPYFGFTYKSPDNGTSHTNLQLGTAFHLLQPLSNSTKLYYGAYLDFTTDALQYNDFNIGPVAGVEYMFAKEFSVAGEVALNFGFGSGTKISTNTSAVLRYYFIGL